MNVPELKISLPLSLEYQKKEIIVTKRIETDECEVCKVKIVSTSSWLGLSENKFVVHLKHNEKIQIKKIPK